MEDADIVVVLNAIALVEHVAALDLAPQARAVVVMDMVATKRDAVAYGILRRPLPRRYLKPLVLFGQMWLSSIRIPLPLPAMPIWPL